MRTIVVVLLITISLFIAGCESHTARYDAALSMAVDQTDVLNQYPTAEQLLLPLGLKDNPNRGIIICIKPLTDRDINPQFTFALERQNALTGNDQLREALIHRLIKRVQKCLDSLRPQKPMSHSVIFRPVTEQANSLLTISAEKRYLLLISDLNENATVSFYNKHILYDLQHHPDKIGRELERDAPLKKLTGMDLWLLYRPNSYIDNRPYQIVSGFYKQVFEQHGANCHIDQNFNPE